MDAKVRDAIAVFDKSAERTTPNAQTAAWATIRAHIEGLEADNERLKLAFDDDDEKASVHWYAEWVEYKRKAEAAEARVRELEGVLRDAPTTLVYAINLCNGLANEALQDEAMRRVNAYNERVKAAMRGGEA
jgi:hypothetical protein